jgi:radical SAM family RiPP maturation amino acid epimerase
MSAARLEDIFTYTPANARLWRSVLKVIKKIIGPAAGTGLCYWATDPLDNPDYEKFCCDFHAILGLFPQTTTAQPLKDPARTRALLQLSLDKGNPLNRFSILSLRMLDRLHAEFSAEELALVDLVLQNKEGTGVIKFEAGRVRDRLKQKSAPTNRLMPGTSACVSGFLINMVERRVKLISPCPASDRWPQGYLVFDEDVFTNGRDLKRLLERMIAEHMPLTVNPDRPVRFRPDLSYQARPDGFQLSTPYARHKIGPEPYLSYLGELIRQGHKTAAEIAQLLEWSNIPSTQTYQTLNLLFRQGVLDEEPAQG